MIDQTDIDNALTDHLAEMSDLPPVSWPNKDLPPGAGRPYLVVQIVPVSRTDRTLGGGRANSRGYMTVTVVTERDTWSAAAGRLADRIADRFAYPLRLTAPGGTITITKPPEPQQGFPDGPDWRVPVRIDYLAH